VSRLAAARTWWLGRTPRERWMLRGLVVALAVFIGWYGVASPAIAVRKAAADHRAEAARTLARIEAAKQTSDPAAPDNLVTLVAGSASASGLVIDRHREDASGAVTVWLDEVEPRRLMGWILKLRRDHGVGVRALAVSRGDAGLRAEVTLAA